MPAIDRFGLARTRPRVETDCDSRSVAFDYLNRTFSTEDVAVICTYFSYKEQETQSAANILAGMLQ